MNGLGVLYSNGRGVRRDDRKARQLFLKAAALGNKEAKENLR
jgi:TPR repeat protein